MRHAALPLSPLYRHAVYLALCQQVFCALVSLLMLEGGRLARVCGVVVAVFWASAALLILSRPAAPGKAQLALIKWGFVPLFALAADLVQRI